MNLLDETKDAIEDSGHKPEDIIFIGSESSGYSCLWSEFLELANRAYDSGFGYQQVATDLVIIFKGGAKMWRSEYDGSECWEYSSPFIQQKRIQPIKSLFVKSTGWENLETINKENQDAEKEPHQ